MLKLSLKEINYINSYSNSADEYFFSGFFHLGEIKNNKFNVRLHLPIVKLLNNLLM